MTARLRICCLSQRPSNIFCSFQEKKHITELIFHLLINSLVNETSDVSVCIKYNIKQDDTMTSVKVKLRLSENVSFIDNSGCARYNIRSYVLKSFAGKAYIIFSL